MTGLRVSLLGAITLTALVAGTVALYAADCEQRVSARYDAAPLHVQKALSLRAQ
ncbi:hypothetical protein [Pseudodonghicola flavimaris]|uniref:Uncharacterized protein n=1 Tax=Pseudodonghicola flavimaris TaxID=3050036 RepID=A0ABT7EWC5_9RHOB|nr:hypothetical protein [Pseudodonghicola flavimaris]MDK3016641.1 hypothetical protein [Pseudodonghicola flavimaris]